MVTVSAEAGVSCRDRIRLRLSPPLINDVDLFSPRHYSVYGMGGRVYE